MGSPRLTAAQRASALEMYADGVPILEIRCRTGVRDPSKLAATAGLPMRGRPGSVVARDDARRFVAEYLAGASIRTIALRYGRAYSVVQRRIAAAAVARSASDGRRRYSLRQDAFAELTPESAYWLGLIASDGGIYRNEIKVTLHDNDRQLLVSLAEFLETDAPIRPYYNESKRASALHITSASMAADLQRWGIGPAKSLTLEVAPDLAAEPAFWRGVVDGDGCIYLAHRHGVEVQVAGSCRLMHQLAAFVTESGIARTRAVQTRGRIALVSLFGRTAQRFLIATYGPRGPRMERKAKLAVEALAKPLNPPGPPRKRVVLTCGFCGAPVERRPSEIKPSGRVFCDGDHARASRSGTRPNP